jgi:hypothetical protein
VQAAVRQIAELRDARKCPQPLKNWKDVTVIETAVRVVRNAQPSAATASRDLLKSNASCSN